MRVGSGSLLGILFLGAAATTCGAPGPRIPAVVSYFDFSDNGVYVAGEITNDQNQPVQPSCYVWGKDGDGHTLVSDQVTFEAVQPGQFGRIGAEVFEKAADTLPSIAYVELECYGVARASSEGPGGEA